MSSEPYHERMPYLSSVICEGHINQDSADGRTRPVSASSIGEKTPLLMGASSEGKGKKLQRSQAILVHLLNATSGVEQRGRCEKTTTDKSCPWDLYHLELEPGVKYTLQVRSADKILTVISFSAPGTGQQALVVWCFDREKIN